MRGGGGGGKGRWKISIVSPYLLKYCIKSTVIEVVHEVDGLLLERNLPSRIRVFIYVSGESI